MVLGPQFRDAFGDEPMKSKAISIINKTAESKNPVIAGADARTVFRATNIRQWPMKLSQTQMRNYVSGVGIDEGWRDYSEVLHTSQTHLHAPTLQKYIRGEAPEMDPDFMDDDVYGESTVRYLPDIATTDRGNPFITEGHHRIVAARLRGEDSDTWESRLHKW